MDTCDVEDLLTLQREEAVLQMVVISTKMNYISNMPRICWQLGRVRAIKITNSNSKT